MPAPLSAGISVVKTTPTATRSPTVPPDQLANARPQGEFSKAKRCLARWVMCVTTQNLEIVEVDVERNLIMVKGAVPGPTGGDVCIRPAVKSGGQAVVLAERANEFRFSSKRWQR